jgi:hypothetical protein
MPNRILIDKLEAETADSWNKPLKKWTKNNAKNGRSCILKVLLSLQDFEVATQANDDGDRDGRFAWKKIWTSKHVLQEKTHSCLTRHATGGLY